MRAALASGPSYRLHIVCLQNDKITSVALITYGSNVFNLSYLSLIPSIHCARYIYFVQTYPTSNPIDVDVCLDIFICFFDTLWQGLSLTSCEIWVYGKTFYNLEDKVGL